jgi:hypothetical protein
MIAVRRRDIPLLVIHAIVLSFMVSTALGTGAMADRFAAPFIPVMMCCALISLSRLKETFVRVEPER